SLALNGTPYLFTNAPPTNAPMWWVSTPYTGPRAPGINIATSLPLTVNPPAGSLVTVSLQLVPTTNVLAYAVEDHPPTGSADVQNISHGGSYDALNRAVKWGPFYDNGTRELTYEIIRPPGAAGTNTFTGLASFDGFNAVISGGRSIVHPATT